MRILLITIMLTLLSFAVSLFLGIVGMVLGGVVRGAHPNMAFAYRHVALPVAAIAAAFVLIAAAFMEIRHYRHARVLDHIEKQLGHAS